VTRGNAFRHECLLPENSFKGNIHNTYYQQVLAEFIGLTLYCNYLPFAPLSVDPVFLFGGPGKGTYFIASDLTPSPLPPSRHFDCDWLILMAPIATLPNPSRF
jgi:hypothetical protein